MNYVKHVYNSSELDTKRWLFMGITELSNGFTKLNVLTAFSANIIWCPP